MLDGGHSSTKIVFTHLLAENVVLASSYLFFCACRMLRCMASRRSCLRTCVSSAARSASGCCSFHRMYSNLKGGREGRRGLFISVFFLFSSSKPSLKGIRGADSRSRERLITSAFFTCSHLCFFLRSCQVIIVLDAINQLTDVGMFVHTLITNTRTHQNKHHLMGYSNNTMCFSHEKASSLITGLLHEFIKRSQW